MTAAILVVDNESGLLRMVEYALGRKFGYHVITAFSDNEAMQWILSGRRPYPELVLLDLSMPEYARMQLIRDIKSANPQLPVIALVPYGDDACAAQAVQAGVCDFLTKPVMLERLKLSLRKELDLKRMSNTILRLARYNNGHASFSDIVGDSTAIKKAIQLAEKAAASKLPVWIEGESGTGKELLARAIHGSGDRAGKPFVTANCTELSEENAEALLFGQAKMPDKSRGRFVLGKLREAEKGTLFLKEIGSLAPALQHRLLEVLHKRSFRPIGSQTPVAADVRLIVSVSQPLQAAGASSNMLYRRFQEICITMPSLHERRDDIALLAKHFIIAHATSENKSMVGLTEAASQHLANVPWPGNIHQLSRLMWQSVVLCNQEMLDLANLQLVERWQPACYKDETDNAPSGSSLLFDRAGKIKKLKSIEDDIIRLALRHNNGCMTRAARQLGIGRSTLYRRIGEFEKDDYISRPSQAMRPMMSVSSAERS